MACFNPEPNILPIRVRVETHSDHNPLLTLRARSPHAGGGYLDLTSIFALMGKLASLDIQSEIWRFGEEGPRVSQLILIQKN